MFLVVPTHQDFSAMMHTSMQCSDTARNKSMETGRCTIRGLLQHFLLLAVGRLCHVQVAQPGNPSSESALLRCLSQLNNDVLEAYLLPRLVEQGSSAAVALSCSQLRRLCQLSTQHLHLSKQLQDADNPCHDAKLARQLMAAFPSCTSLDFSWASSSLANVSRSITPLLAG